MNDIKLSSRPWTKSKYFQSTPRKEFQLNKTIANKEKLNQLRIELYEHYNKSKTLYYQKLIDNSKGDCNML